MKMILTLVSAASLATAAGGEPVVVIHGDPQSMVKIAHDDLNLASERGRDRLSARVNAAVRAMCRDDNRDLLAIEMSEQRCFALSMREASTQVERAIRARSLGMAGSSLSVTVVRR